MEYNSKTASCHAIHYYHQPSNSNGNSNSNNNNNSTSSSSRSRSSGQHQHQQLTSSASTSSSTSSLQRAGSRYALHKDHKYPFELVENEDDDIRQEAEDEGGQELVEYQRYARKQKQRYYGHTVGQRSRRRYYKYDAVEECCRPIFQDQQCDSLTEML
ncbi:homeotic protein female sterile [Drosophila madeirensis]|uniref:Homeotic protein female sterile n=1 Tax=Drosophila madeirensis TaxID=30013 RepID=A0AAU9FYR2_DROMD